MKTIDKAKILAAQILHTTCTPCTPDKSEPTCVPTQTGSAGDATEAGCLPEEAGKLRLSDLFRRGPVHQVRSRVLGEDVLFAADNAEIPPDNALVVYRESELRQVVGRSPEEMRKIHLVKKMIDGEIIDNGEVPSC